MWLSILSLLFGSLPAIAGQIAAAKTASVNAKTEQERIAADENIKTLEARRDALVAEASSPWNAVARAVLIIPPTIYLGKIFIWDKVLGLGNTDGLTDQLWYLVYSIFGYYFLADLSKIWKR